ncbi:MAG: hypothetical protein K8R23_10490 [Chthoniobacter sp.]|nr:hypothetical protein [Chthoniobacter sp.]
MKLPRLFPIAAVLALATGQAAEPLYHNDFATAEPGKVPAEFMVMSGDFLLREDAKDGRFLELPGEPLDTFGLLFGPTPKGDVTASARFFGTKKGRKFPAFGVSLGGVGGYRLQVSAAKKTLEIFQGDEARQSVAYEWPDASWTSLRVQVRKDAAGWIVEGKAWPAGTPEPAAWTITYTTKAEPPAGRPGIWGSPYSGTPIRFADLDLSPAH